MCVPSAVALARAAGIVDIANLPTGQAAGWFLRTTEDFYEAKRAFIEKREPNFQGR